jgi:DNA-binding FadR family transcriptional regulator
MNQIGKSSQDAENTGRIDDDRLKKLARVLATMEEIGKNLSDAEAEADFQMFREIVDAQRPPGYKVFSHE